MLQKKIAPLFFFIFCLIGCNLSKEKTRLSDITQEDEQKEASLFNLLPSERTHVDFQNILKEGLNANVLVYEYLYNGGGVAVGDFNADGFEDIYFTSNMGENKFYINQGNLTFMEVSQISKVQGRPGPWKTGITSADVNGDGKLDLYLCYSGALPDAKRKNQLFINQGNNEDNIPIFKEEAEAYGLASSAYSNQGYFLDYDRDGDLDMLLLNHSPKSLPVLNEVLTKEILKKDDPLQGLRVYRQDNGKFIDVTTSTGVNGSGLSYGLGIGISDVNDDGWLDFYVSNDYTIPDYLYINNGDGTFTDQLKNQLGHTSHFSMGNNIADINNDGLQDIYTLDMLPEDNKRQKLLLSPDNYEKFDLNLRSGFHYQYMRNMLQVNNGNNSFSEVGQLSGVSNTDWSWAPLFADFDNDGFKDLFVTNGYYRDYTNLDFINYLEDFVQAKGRLKREDVLDLIAKMPSSDLTNYYFSNTNGLSFIDSTKKSGIAQPSNSNGAAYVDLDNDGDLELIVNNINKAAFIYENTTSNGNTNYLKIKLEGDDQNSQGIGSKVTVYTGNEQQVMEQVPNRGYLSTVSPILHFGLGPLEKVDSLIIRWNSGKTETRYALKSNATITLRESDAIKTKYVPRKQHTIFTKSKALLSHTNKASNINDFKRQPLLPKQISHHSPAMAVGDFNKDGLEDIVIGGGMDQPTSLYLRQQNGSMKPRFTSDFSLDSRSLDTHINVMDANSDGNLDLYIASGGYHDLSPDDVLYKDRLYLGDGKGNFTKSIDALPEIFTNTIVTASADINGDTFPDIFVGAGVIPGRYPEISKSYFLLNNGRGQYSVEIDTKYPDLQNLGIISDAKFTDFNGDKSPDLIVVGEWMPITILINQNGSFANKTNDYFDTELKGLWNTVELTDVNDDGFVDILAGNLGTNSQFNIDKNHPAILVYEDFDNNGSIDPVLNFYVGDTSYPYLTRDELVGQLAYLKQKYTSYSQYSEALLTDIFSEKVLHSAKKLEANYAATALLSNNGNGKFEESVLPIQAQFSPVHKILVHDFDKNGKKDILVLGNNDYYKLRIGKFDANYGTLLLQDEKGNFEYVPQNISGLDVRGSQVNGVVLNDYLLIQAYGKPLESYKFLD